MGGLAAFLYIVTLGMTTLRKGHWVMFVAGILPLFWLIGATMPPTGPASRQPA